MTEMTPAKATALRKPFPKESIGKLPKGGAMLDYVGHAAVTDRLLSVDPDWSWEPFSVGADGLPALDRSNNLWIRLTICGVTRIGVGDGKSAKECIGDAIRNAAMRFGVALDLWAKEDLVEFAQAASGHHKPPAGEQAPDVGSGVGSEPEVGAASPAGSDEPPATVRTAGGASAAQVKNIARLMTKAHIDTREGALLYVNDLIGRTVASRNELTSREASAVISALKIDTGEDGEQS